VCRAEPNKRKLTSLTVTRPRPAAKPYLIWDEKQSGLALQVQPSGYRAYKLIYRHHGRPRWYHITNADAIALADARKEAAKLMLRVIPWRHADQYHARLSPNVLEGVCRPSRDKHDRLSGRDHEAVTKLEFKLTFYDVEEFVFRLMDVCGRSALRRDGLTKQAYRSAGLVSGRHYFGHIGFSAFRPREPRGTVRQNDEPRFCGDCCEKPNRSHHGRSGEQGG